MRTNLSVSRPSPLSSSVSAGRFVLAALIAGGVTMGRISVAAPVKAQKPVFMTAEARSQYLSEHGLTMELPLKLGAVQANRTELPRGELFELTFPLEASFANPFDPDDIRVDGTVVTPGGHELTIPCFFYTPYELNEDGSVLQRLPPVWKLRFTPLQEGTYRYRVQAADRSGTAEGSWGTFNCVAGNYDGFVRRSARPGGLEFDNGRPYYPNGPNLLCGARPNAPVPDSRVEQQLEWLRDLGRAKANFVRFRVDSYYTPIESTENAESGYLGMGWYQQKVCFDVDRVYREARQQGIQIMHCFYNANIMVGGHLQFPWARQYCMSLQENGGPCETQEQFWTHPEALRLVRCKLRYSTARWGYSPNLMCWEFFNEVGGLEQPVRREWHAEMARYLRSIDPYAHPVSTSMHYRVSADNSFWDMPEMDIVQTHIYNQLDNIESVRGLAHDIVSRFDKPVIFGEWGLHSRNQEWWRRDSAGVGMFNAMYAAAFTGAAGMSDWYGQPIRQFNLFHHYCTFAELTREVPWNDPALREHPVRVTRAEVAGNGPGRDVLIRPAATDNFAKMEEKRFVADPVTGEVSNRDFLQPFLHGGASRKSCPVFVLDAAGPCEFVITVTGSVGNADNRLEVSVDGAEPQSFPCPAEKGEGRHAEYIPQYSNWRVEYTEPIVFTFPLAVGHHEIRCEAVAKDRIEVEYRITRYAKGPDPVSAYAMGCGPKNWLWLHNDISAAACERAGVTPCPLTRVEGILEEIPDAVYSVTWYDPWTGNIIAEETVPATQTALAFTGPAFVRDLIAVIRAKQ